MDRDKVVVKAPSSTFRATISLKRKYAHLIKLINEYPVQSEKSMFMADLMMDGLKFREMVNSGAAPNVAGTPQIAAGPPSLRVAKELSDEEMNKKFNSNFFTVIAPAKKVEASGLNLEAEGNNGEVGPEEDSVSSE